MVNMMDYIEMQENRERRQLEQVCLAMGDKAIAWEMFDFIRCMSTKGHPTARRIVTRVMTYEPPQPVREYMEVGDTEIF